MADRPFKTDNPVVVIESTLGKIAVELFPKEAPDTVANFVKLVEKGYYNGVLFHRVIPKFMVQTGDPTGTGRGGPGWTITMSSIPSCATRSRASCRWPTPAPIPAALSSSSLWARRRTSTTATPCSGR